MSLSELTIPRGTSSPKHITNLRPRIVGQPIRTIVVHTPLCSPDFRYKARRYLRELYRADSRPRRSQADKDDLRYSTDQLRVLFPRDSCQNVPRLSAAFPA